MSGALPTVTRRKSLPVFFSFFKDLGVDFARGDIFVKLSALVMGMGYFKRRQIAKGIIMTIFQVVIILFVISFAVPYLSKFGSLGTVQFKSVFNPDTMKNEFNDYDHSFLILLYGIISIIMLFCSFYIYLRNIRVVRALELKARRGERIPTFLDDVKSFKNERFYVTLLTLPCLGVVLFTIIPLIVMITVAFTNYDQQNMPPTFLFTWVGIKNFISLFSNNVTSSFRYAFGKVLSWTLLWAFAATFSNFVLGILLTVFINDQKTKLKRVWRTMFIISIAVPQFVTLLLVRSLFLSQGLVNTFITSDHEFFGMTFNILEFLKSIKFVPEGLSYVPFLTHPVWAKFMIIFINIWIGVPYMMLITTGVLMNIPKELYESAKIDGAGPFKSFIYITMPYVLFVTGPFLVTQVVHNINNFNVIYLLTEGFYVTTDQALANANAREVDLLVTWLYRLTQDYYNYKMASVIGIMVFLVCAVLTLVAFNVVLKRNKEDKFQI